MIFDFAFLTAAYVLAYFLKKPAWDFVAPTALVLAFVRIGEIRDEVMALRREAKERQAYWQGTWETRGPRP